MFTSLISYLFNKNNKIWLEKQIIRHKNLKSNEKLILLELSDYVNIGYKSTGIDYCFPSIKTLSNNLNISCRTIITCIKLLEKNKFISIKKEINHSNKYKILSNNFNSQKTKTKKLNNFGSEKISLPQ